MSGRGPLLPVTLVRRQKTIPKCQLLLHEAVLSTEQMMEMLITEAPEGQRGGNPHGQGGEDLGEEGRVVIGQMSKARGDMKGSDSVEEAVLSKVED